MNRTGWLLAVIWMLGGSAAAAAQPKDPHADLPRSHSVTPELAATGFEFAEGPALDAKGNLYVANYRSNGNIGRIAPDGTARIFCNLTEAAPADGSQPRANGMKIDSMGQLIVADSGTGRLLRISTDGLRVEVLADRFDGKRFSSVHDVALDRAGNIFFSDPGDSDRDDPTGTVYRYDILTAQVSQAVTGLASPGGLAVTPDQKHLCVSESDKFRIMIYGLSEKGHLADGRVLITFPVESEGNIAGGRFQPEGMVFDAKGRLYVAMWTGDLVNVVEVSSGTIIRQYEAGGLQATNCHFHAGYLYTTVAAKEAVFRLKLGVEGFRYSRSPDVESVVPETDP
ncbi:MAG: SMP-30/gluconolactonase/LRE family protein [Planctomycetes bacterium]|nr:SMP-30/gluconolactonase/LRE family protein [Planctomycetota bacterium]